MVKSKDKTCHKVHTGCRDTKFVRGPLDHAIYLKQIVMELTAVDGDSIPIETFVDNQSVEDALYSTKSVDEKWLRIDIESIKQMLTTEKVAKIQWIPGDKMIANGLTKRGAQTYDFSVDNSSRRTFGCYCPNYVAEVMDTSRFLKHLFLILKKSVSCYVICYVLSRH